MPKFAKGDRVVLSKLSHFDPSDYGMDNAEYENLLNHDGCEGTVDCEATDGYYDVTMDSGFEIAALSDYHLTKVAK